MALRFFAGRALSPPLFLRFLLFDVSSSLSDSDSDSDSDSELESDLSDPSFEDLVACPFFAVSFGSKGRPFSIALRCSSYSFW